ncbi:MAG TPA: SCO family protein [Polyangia bacterium]|nr:SCO family protein [Polyangia bacterium]
MSCLDVGRAEPRARSCGLATLLAVVAGVVPAACQRRHPPAAAAVPTARQSLPGVSDVPAFSFTNVDGRPVDGAALRGHVWIADFIFTRCTTICPIITAKMNVLRRSIRSPETRFVSFSIDPEHDTPAALRDYAARWDADPRWLLLSPPSEAVVTDFAKAMNMPFKHTAMPLEPIMHTSLFFLVDGDGRLRGQYSSLDDTAVRRLAADAAALDASPPSAEPAGGAGASRGQALFRSLGCAACHADRRTGPPLAGLAGHRVRLEGGATVVADAAYLRRSILAPMESVTRGYNPLMPGYDGYLAAADVDDLVAYLQSISPAAGPTAH